MHRKGKDIRKKDIIFLTFQFCVVTNLLAIAVVVFVFVPSMFGEKFPPAEF
jgi:hypothetical protein